MARGHGSAVAQVAPMRHKPGGGGSRVVASTHSGRVQPPDGTVAKLGSRTIKASRVRFSVIILAGMMLAAPATAGPNDVHNMVRAGEIMPFEAIQRRVVQETPGEYVGVQFDQSSRIYRFRFLREGAVVNVDVDARTGERLRRKQSY